MRRLSVEKRHIGLNVQPAIVDRAFLEHWKEVGEHRLRHLLAGTHLSLLIHSSRRRRPMKMTKGGITSPTTFIAVRNFTFSRLSNRSVPITFGTQSAKPWPGLSPCGRCPANSIQHVSGTIAMTVDSIATLARHEEVQSHSTLVLPTIPALVPSKIPDGIPRSSGETWRRDYLENTQSTYGRIIAIATVPKTWGFLLYSGFGIVRSFAHRSRGA